MSQEAKISQLRTLLSATPDKAGWEAIWKEVESWSKYQNHAVALDYLGQHIARWSDELRLLPYKCNDDWLQGASHPMFPFVRGLAPPPPYTYTEPKERWRGLQSPYAAALTHITFRGYIRDLSAFAQALTQSPARLRSLTWSHSDIAEQGLLQALCTLKPLQGLTRLDLSFNGLTRADWRLVLQHAPPALEQLDVSYNQLHASDVYQLFASERFGSLRSLNLAGNRIATQRLCPHASALRHLERLDLSFNGVGGRGLQQLRDAGALDHLTALDLSGNPLTPRDAQRVAASLPHGLRTLTLRCADLGDEGLLQLADHLPSGHQLDVLDISGNHISEEAHQQLVASPALATTELRCDSPLFSRERHATLRTAAYTQGDGATHVAFDMYGISPTNDTVVVTRSTGSTASETVARVLAGEFDTTRPGGEETLPPLREGTPGTAELCRWIGQFGRRMTQPESRLRCLLQRLHTAFFEQSSSPRGYSRPMSQLSATFAAGVFYHGHLLTAHEGKVRIYRWRRGKLTQLTEDHSLIQELRKQGKSTDELNDHPYKNVVLKTLGLEEEFDTEFHYHTVEESDVYFMCTSDIHETLTDEAIATILDEHIDLEQSNPEQRSDLQHACRRIIDATVLQRDDGNCAALLVHCCGMT